MGLGLDLGLLQGLSWGWDWDWAAGCRAQGLSCRGCRCR